MILEACVDSIRSAVAAEHGGADRVELCGNLVEGGTTPGPGTIGVALETLRIPIFVMVRPRGGDFLYSDLEYASMLRDIAAIKQAGAPGVVTGVLKEDGSIDGDRMRELIRIARPMSVTFHRAFDVSRDPFESLDQLLTLGVDRVLTSGQEHRAVDALALIGKLVREAGDHLVVLVGGGVNADNVGRIRDATGAREFHAHTASKVRSGMKYIKPGVPMGASYVPDEYQLDVTDGDDVRAIKEVLEASQ